MNNMSIENVNNTIKGFLNNDGFGKAKLSEFNDFIDKNLRTILQQTETSEAKDLQANLVALSNKINKDINNPQAHELSFNIMGIALGLLSGKKNNYLQDEIPSDVFSIIVDNLNPRNRKSDIKFLKSIERTSTMWRKEVNAYIHQRIYEDNLSLSIVGCETGSKAINYIIEKKLQCANLSDISDITDTDLKKLIENCSELHKLYLRSSKITKVSFEKLKALQILNLEGCTMLSEDKLAKGLDQLTALRSLHLVDCTQLSGGKLAKALDKHTALTNLNLAWCTQLSADKLIQALGKLQAIINLNLEDCRQLSGDKLAEVLGKLTTLKILNLARCRQLSGDKLSDALGNLRALNSLNLYRCTQLSGDKLSDALGNLRALNSLNLYRCTQLSGDKFSDALGNLRALESLNLYRCEQLSGDKLAEASASLQPFKAWNFHTARSFRGDKSLRPSASLQPFNTWIFRGAHSFREMNCLRPLASLQPFITWIFIDCPQLSGDKMVEALGKLKGRGVRIIL